MARTEGQKANVLERNLGATASVAGAMKAAAEKFAYWKEGVEKRGKDDPGVMAAAADAVSAINMARAGEAEASGKKRVKDSRLDEISRVYPSAAKAKSKRKPKKSGLGLW